MMRTPSAFLAALTLLPGLALAQTHEFAISGSGTSGRATVEETGAETARGRAVNVHVTFKRFTGETAKIVDLDGPGTLRPDGSLEWSYQTEVTEHRSGLIDWFRHPYLTTPAPTTYTTDMRSRMRARAGGRLEGMVAGHSQVWSPAPDTSNLVVLMIPGLSTNYWNRMGLPYFDTNRDALIAQGFEVRRIGTKDDGSIDTDSEFKTENSVAKNAKLIAIEIRAEAERGNRVIIFAHSKGGTDATAAIALDPSLVEHVAGMIAIQPVYGGSPISDFAASSWAMTAGVAIALEVWAGGNRDAVIDLTTKRRDAFVAAHPFPTDLIPTVVIRSTFDRNKLIVGPMANGERLKDPGKRLFQRVLRTNQALIKVLRREDSDGMVTLAAQTIPGAVHIDKDDLDHFEPGLEMISRHSPADLTTEAIVRLVELMRSRSDR